AVEDVQRALQELGCALRATVESGVEDFEGYCLGDISDRVEVEHIPVLLFGNLQRQSTREVPHVPGIAALARDSFRDPPVRCPTAIVGVVDVAALEAASERPCSSKGIHACWPLLVVSAAEVGGPLLL